MAGLLRNAHKLLMKRNSVVCLPVSTIFHEADRKGGYGKPIKKKPLKKEIVHGWSELKLQSSKLIEEWKVKARSDSYHGPLINGDYEVVYKFDNQEIIDDFVVTTDLDHNEGKSTAEFVLGPKKTGIFRGVINCEVPKDGVLKNAGYATIRSPRAMKSFHRTEPFDWTDYTHLVFRCRGDGRSYQVILQMDRYFDVTWNDHYTYALFTRGGPYWQTAKIPFSKFYLAAKGRIQDKQEKVQLQRITNVGVTLADSYNGPFNLEIDFVGCIFDEGHNEDFAYELYKTSMTAIM